jgi:hypothetical protein
VPEMGKIRPQILVAGIEIMTAIIGGIFGFLGGVSLKVLENE